MTFGKKRLFTNYFLMNWTKIYIFFITFQIFQLEQPSNNHGIAARIIEINNCQRINTFHIVSSLRINQQFGLRIINRHFSDYLQSETDILKISDCSDVEKVKTKSLNKGDDGDDYFVIVIFCFCALQFIFGFILFEPILIYLIKNNHNACE